jgi:hypothetical protein
LTMTVKPPKTLPDVQIIKRTPQHAKIKINTVTRLKFRIGKVFTAFVLLPACAFFGLVMSFEDQYHGSKWDAVQYELSYRGTYGHRPKWERYLGLTFKTNWLHWIGWTVGIGFFVSYLPYRYKHKLVIDIKPDAVQIAGKRYDMAHFGGFLMGKPWVMDSNHPLHKSREKTHFTALNYNYGEYGPNLATPYLINTEVSTSATILLNSCLAEVRKPPEQREKEQTGKQERF